MTMEKTPEEIKAAVNEECKRLCTDGSQPKMFWGSIFMRDGRPNVVFKLFGSYGRAVDELDSNLIRLLYCLLGLEARESRERLALLQSDLAYANKALDMANDVALGLTDGCLTDKVRASKLVAALEKIANDGFEDDSEYHTGYLDAYCELKWVAEAALAEWKGGAGE